MNPKWAIDSGAIRKAPGGNKIADIPLGTILTPTGNQQNLVLLDHQTLWSEITLGGQLGWVNDAYLEDYIEKFQNEVAIANPTPNPNDAAQYILVDGNIKNRLCGEFCVAFIVGESIDDVLKKWRESLPDAFNKIIGDNNDKGTGPGTLENILKLYEYKRELGHILDFKAGLTDPVIDYQPSAGRFKKMLETHRLIAGLKIDGVSGRLRGGGVEHWVVLDKITPIGRSGGNGGWVELYNPFPNRREEYSYDEFASSCGGVDNWNGIWVQRVIP